MNFIDLKKLPWDDPRLLVPLHKLGAQYKNVKAIHGWLPAPETGVGRYCFNELGGPWIEFTEWRAPNRVIDRGD